MDKQAVLCFGLLALSTLAVAAPKAHEVVITSATQAGDVQVTPGDYKVTIEGGNAIFKEAHTHKLFTIPVKVEETTKKYNETSVQTRRDGSVDQLTAIELGGSKTKLEFGQQN